MKQGWEIKPFEEILEKVKYSKKIPKQQYKKRGTYPIVSQEQEIISGFWDEKNDLFRLNKPIVIFGDHTKVVKYIDFDFVIGADGVKILSPTEEILTKYLYYFVLSVNLRDLGYARHFRLLKEQKIPVPSLLEQGRIVEVLDAAFAKIDALKENAQKNLENAKALFQQVLKQELTPKPNWQTKKLSEIATDFSRGKSKHRPRNDKKLFGGNYPFIQTGDIRNSQKYVKKFNETYNEFGLSQSKLWPKGTLCITIAANIAETAILDFPCCFPDSVIGLVPNNKLVDVNFIYFTLLLYKNELQNLGKGSAQDNINLGTFEKNQFPFPTKKEQEETVMTIDAISQKCSKVIANAEKTIAECDALKQAVLRRAFNGEL